MDDSEVNVNVLQRKRLLPESTRAVPIGAMCPAATASPSRLVRTPTGNGEQVDRC